MILGRMILKRPKSRVYKHSKDLTKTCVTNAINRSIARKVYWDGKLTEAATALGIRNSELMK